MSNTSSILNFWRFTHLSWVKLKNLGIILAKNIWIFPCLNISEYINAMQCSISCRFLSCLNNRLQRKLVHLQTIHNPTHWSTNSLKKAVDAPDPYSSTCSIMLDRCCYLGRFMEVVIKKIFYNQADRKCENFDPLEYSKESLSRCFGTLINPYGHPDHKLYVFFWWLPSVNCGIFNHF